MKSFEQPNQTMEQKIQSYLNETLPESEPRIEEPMDPDCEVAIVIPSLGEREYLFRPLKSLLNQKGVEAKQFEVIMVINNPKEVPEQQKNETDEGYQARKELISQSREENQQVLKILQEINAGKNPEGLTSEEEELVKLIQTSGMRIYAIDKASTGNELSKALANVGGARNRGVAEAVERFQSIKRNGVIVQTDAEAAFDEHYLSRALKLFKDNPDLVGASGYLEMDISAETDPLMKKVHYFANLEKLYKALAAQAMGKDLQAEKEKRFTGANMVSRAFETAAVGGVPTVGQREDTEFKERLDTIGKTKRIPELITRPVDRISQRTGGIEKGHGHIRYRMAKEIEVLGEINDSLTGKPITEAIDELLIHFLKDDETRKRYEQTFLETSVKSVPAGIPSKLAEYQRKLESLLKSLHQ